MHYCLIYNLNSSSGKKLKLINKICEKLKINNTVDYFKTKSEKEAKNIFLKFKNKNYDRLIVAGGDGSVSFAINELIKMTSFLMIILKLDIYQLEQPIYFRQSYQ